MNRDERTTAVGLWQYGKAYLQAANHLFSLADELNLTAPIYYLYSHAMELALKGYLRAHGASLNDLRNFKHGLTPLLKRARTQGLDQGTSPNNDMNLIGLLDVYNKDHEFRYIVTGFKTLPTLDALHGVAERLLLATRATCLKLD